MKHMKHEGTEKFQVQSSGRSECLCKKVCSCKAELSHNCNQAHLHTQAQHSRPLELLHSESKTIYITSYLLPSLPILQSGLSPTCPRKVHCIHPPLLHAFPPLPVLGTNPPVPTRRPVHVAFKIRQPGVVPGVPEALGVPCCCCHHSNVLNASRWCT